MTSRIETQVDRRKIPKMAGAYNYQKAPKYRKATKIPESTYKYQKAMENIGKVRVLSLCMDYKLLFLCAWIMIDAHKCSTLGKSMVYVPTKAIIHLMHFFFHHNVKDSVSFVTILQRASQQQAHGSLNCLLRNGETCNKSFL